MTEKEMTPEILPGSPRAKSIRILVLSILIMVLVIYLVAEDLQGIETWIRNNGALGLAVSVLVYAVLGASLIPAEPLTVVIAAAFGPLPAIFASTLGNLLAALVEYFIGARLHDATNFTEQKKHLPFGIGNLPVDSPLFLILGRVIPGAGPKLVGILGGMYKVPLFRFTWTAIIPILLGSILFAYGGAGLINLIKR